MREQPQGLSLVVGHVPALGLEGVDLHPVALQVDPVPVGGALDGVSLLQVRPPSLESVV